MQFVRCLEPPSSLQLVARPYTRRKLWGTIGLIDPVAAGGRSRQGIRTYMIPWVIFWIVIVFFCFFVWKFVGLFLAPRGGPLGPPRGPKMGPGTPGIDLKSPKKIQKFGPEVSTIFEI